MHVLSLGQIHKSGISIIKKNYIGLTLLESVKLGTREMAQLVKDFAHNHENMNLIPSIHAKAPCVECRSITLVLGEEGGRDKWIPGATWPTSERLSQSSTVESN